jgi:ERCC4-type nuclease
MKTPEQPPIYVVDNREKCPYQYDGAIRKTLVTGDYSVTGMEDKVAFERKSLFDLLGVMGTNRDRFAAEISRLRDFPYPAVIVEATLREVLIAESQIHWNSRLGTLVSWSLKNRIPFWFCDNRRLAEILVERLLVKAQKYAGFALRTPRKKPGPLKYFH